MEEVEDITAVVAPVVCGKTWEVRKWGNSSVTERCEIRAWLPSEAANIILSTFVEDTARISPRAYKQNVDTHKCPQARLG